MTLPGKRLDRYLWTQFSGTVGFTLLLLTVIWLSPEILFKLTQALFAKKVTLAQYGSMLGYHIPPILQQCLPMSVFFGCLFAVRRLSLNLEWQSLLSAGLSPGRLLLPVVMLGMVAAGLEFGIQECWTPNTSPRLERLYWQTGVKTQRDNAFIYVEKDHAFHPKRFFFVGQAQYDHLSQFIVLDYQPGLNHSLHLSQILKAESGFWQPQTKQWILNNGFRYQLDQDGVYQSAQTFVEWPIKTTHLIAQLLQYQFHKPMDMSRAQLLKYIQLLVEGGQTESIPFFKVRLYQKWTPPLACLLFGFLGTWLGVEPVRSRRQDSLILGAFVLFAYGISLPLFTNLGTLGVLAPWMVALAPLVVSLSVTLGGLWAKTRIQA